MDECTSIVYLKIGSATLIVLFKLAMFVCVCVVIGKEMVCVVFLLIV